MSCDPAAVADLLNAGFAEAARLPRVVAWPQEIPEVSAEDVAARYADPETCPRLYTAEREGRLVALVEAQVSGESGKLGRFVTHPDYRREGLGAACLGRALAALREGGARQVETASFVDSRVTSACAFLEAAGFTVRDPERQNIVMQIDMERYEPVPIVLPPDFRIESLRPEWVPLWLQTKDRVFGGSSPADWFEQTFSRRWDFEWEGWLTLWRGEEMIGLSGADLFRDPNRPQIYSGAQIEYVGVAEGHRGLRLGKMIVGACLNYIKARSLPCQLITQAFRVPAVTLYEQFGFRLVRENRIYERAL